MLLFERLSQQEQMTTVEKMIADYFLNIGYAIEEKSSRKIAAELYVSPSSISRFCQMIGYTGFNSFKTSYLKDLSYLDTNFHEVNPNAPFSARDKNKALANKLAALYTETIEDTLGLVHHDSIQAATQMLLAAKTIIIGAAGDPLEMAETFKNRMLKIGRQVLVERRLDNLFYQASYVKPDTCFILLSYSGEVDGLIKTANILKENAIPFMVVTSYGDNTLAHLAPLTLHLSTREKMINNLGNFSSLLSLSFVMDLLYASVFGDNYAQNQVKRQQVSSDFEVKRKSHNPLIDDSQR